MGGFIKVETEKMPTQGLNMQVNKKIFHEFKVKCKQRNLPLNIVIETFMNQYANKKYKLSSKKIFKWKKDCGETETLNTPINKEVYGNFKDMVKANGYFLRHVISAFIEDYVENDMVMEFVKCNSSKK